MGPRWGLYGSAGLGAERRNRHRMQSVVPSLVGISVVRRKQLRKSPSSREWNALSITPGLSARGHKLSCFSGETFQTPEGFFIRRLALQLCCGAIFLSG